MKATTVTVFRPSPSLAWRACFAFGKWKAEHRALMEGAVDVAKVAAFVTVVALAFFAFPAVGVCVGLTVATAATVALIAKCCLVAFTILVLLKLLACCLAGGYSHDKDSVAESGSSQSSAHGKGPFRDPEFSHTEQSRSESSPVS